MVENNAQYSIDFSEILFDIPDPIVDPKDDNNLIYHQFHSFLPNRQQDSFECCDQLFDVFKEHLINIYELFCITTLDQTTCNNCENNHEPQIISQHALSVPIDNNAIKSVQNALDSFQEEETLKLNCNLCESVIARKTSQLFHSSTYLIIQLKRFKKTSDTVFTKNTKNIMVNDTIIIDNDHISKRYSLQGIVHHLGSSIHNGHYICQCLINGSWYEINDNQFKPCSMPTKSSTCYITLWKMMDDNLEINNDVDNTNANNNVTISKNQHNFHAIPQPIIINDDIDVFDAPLIYQKPQISFSKNKNTNENQHKRLEIKNYVDLKNP
jgi:ubiquitin C-terminal hydrolase